MAIDFACRCGKKLRARADMAGRPGRCTACGEPYVIPRPKKPSDVECDELEVIGDASASSPTPVHVPASLQGSAGQYFQAPKRESTPGWLIPLAAISVVAAVVIMGLGILFSSILRHAPAAPLAALDRPEPPLPSTNDSSSSNDSPVHEVQQVAAPVTRPDEPTAAAPATGRPAGGPWVLPATDGGRSIRIAVTDSNRDHHVFSQNGAFVLVNGLVHDLLGDRAVGPPLTGLAKHPATLALSPDGKLLAEARANSHVRIWSCETSAQVGTSPVPAHRFGGGVAFLGFSDEVSLLVVSPTQQGARMQTWDARSNRIRQEHALDPIPFHAAGALSPNGKQLALGRDNGVAIYDVATGKSVIQFTAPKGDHIFKINQIAFSADGSQVAACTAYDHRLLCWSMSGHIMLDKPLKELGASGAFSHQNTLQWVPDGSGWLLGGTELIDRNALRVVWRLRGFNSGNRYHQFLDKDCLLVCEGTHNQRILRDIAVPWATLRQAVAALQSNSSTVLPAVTEL